MRIADVIFWGEDPERSRITCLALTHKGQTWLGGESGGLCRHRSGLDAEAFCRLVASTYQQGIALIDVGDDDHAVRLTFGDTP